MIAYRCRRDHPKGVSEINKQSAHSCAARLRRRPDRPRFWITRFYGGPLPNALRSGLLEARLGRNSLKKYLVTDSHSFHTFRGVERRAESAMAQDKQTVNAREALDDLRSGMKDMQLMEKYELSARGLVSLFTMLVDAGLITQTELDRRTNDLEGDRTVELAMSRCPSCDMPQYTGFDRCSQCGLDFFRRKPVESAYIPPLRPDTFIGDEIDFSLPGTPEIQAIFRGGLQRTGSYEGPGIQEAPEAAWKFKTGGWVCSSPSVFDGAVYFGSLDGNFYCVDARTGEEKWRFNAGSSIYSSCAIAESMVFFGALDASVYCLAVNTGELIRTFLTAGPIYSSPAVSRGIVYFGSLDGRVYAGDIWDGHLVWRFRTGAPIYSSPAIDNETLCFGSLDGNLYALDAFSGREMWRFKAGGIVSHAPAVQGSTVLFGSGDRKFYAVNVHTGKEKWRFDTGEKITSSPATAAGVVYFGSGDRRLYAVDIKTGLERWRFKTDGAIHSSPSLAGGVVHFGSDDKCLYGVDTDMGSVLWRFRTGSPIYSAPAVVDGALYCGSDDGFVYALR